MKKVITCDREWLEKPETKQMLGEVLTDSTDDNSVEGAISTMLDYLENVNETKFDFSDDEINELVKLIEE